MHFSAFPHYVSIACIASLLAAATPLPGLAEEAPVAAPFGMQEKTGAVPPQKQPDTAPKAEPKAESKKDTDYVILDIDGEKVRYSEVIAIWNGLFPEGSAPEFSRFDEKVRQNVLRGVISERLIYKQARASGLESSEKVQTALKRLKEKLITQLFLEQKSAEKITDEMLRAEYDKRTNALKGKKELHARHILVDSEDEAQDIIEKLDDGEDFEKLAREHSKDRASAVKGGDLGWFGENEMIDEFTKAAFAMKKDDVSEEPVKSDFGWHVIRVEDERDAVLGSFEELKESIRNELKSKALNRYINELVDTAHVKYYDAAGKDLELTKVPDSTTETEQ